jgi:hypothetical protein
MEASVQLRSAALVFVSVFVWMMFPAAGNAASLSAGSEICAGFYGSVGSLRLNCAYGGASDPTATIPGGSGAGSGINSPFFTYADGSEFSATAAALQDYGAFRAYAALHATDQSPDLFGGVYRARAYGESTDTWTVGGGSGAGLINFAFTVTGSAAGTLYVSNGHGGEGASADLSILADLIRPGVPTQTATLCCVVAGGTYLLNPGNGSGLSFTFGEPFDLHVTTIVFAGGGYDPNNPPLYFGVDATAAFEHTATLTGVVVTDAFGDPVPGITIASGSGTVYPLAVPTPLPPAFVSLGAALGLLGCRRSWRRRR